MFKSGDSLVLCLVPTVMQDVYSIFISILLCSAQVLEILPSCCNFGSILAIVFPCVWYVASSANKSKKKG